MSNYAPYLPRDKGGEPMQEFPAPFLANQRYTSENATASSVITVNAATTTLEIAAVGGAAAMKWIPTTDSTASVITIAGATSNYDHIISANTVRRFVIPKETGGAATGTSSVVGANAANGLYQRVAVKSMGVASVLLSEY